MAWYDKFKPGDTIKSRNTICMDDGEVHIIHATLDGKLYVQCREHCHMLTFAKDFYTTKPKHSPLSNRSHPKKISKTLRT